MLRAKSAHVQTVVESEGRPLDTLGRVGRKARLVGRRIRRRGGWVRIIRNAVAGYFEQAGSRMAAALSYYSIFVGGPVLVLTLLLGSAVFGEVAAREAVAGAVQQILPPGAQGLTAVADQIVQTSTPTVSLALLAGLTSLLGFTRALAATLNVTLKTEGTETLQRTVLIGPLLLLAVLGLLWGAWAFELVMALVQLSTNAATSGLTRLVLEGVAPLLLATLYFAIILAVVPRTQLSRIEVLVPAVLGASLWEGARHLFGWLVGADNAYVRVFGPLGGVVALLGWVYISCAIIVLSGQLAWAHAMERRGRGHLAYDYPRQAGLDGWMPPFEGDNMVNEDHE